MPEKSEFVRQMEVVENNLQEYRLVCEERDRRLEECEGPHDFQCDRSLIPLHLQKYICSKCGGWVGHTEKVWYERGLEHKDKLIAKIKRFLVTSTWCAVGGVVDEVIDSVLGIIDEG